MSTDFNFAEFQSKAIEELKSGKGICGTDNVLLPMIKHLLEAGLKAELDLHMEEERIEKPKNNNRKNGSTCKSITSSLGEFTLDTPRDRDSNFTPELVEKQRFILMKPLLKLFYRYILKGYHTTKSESTY